MNRSVDLNSSGAQREEARKELQQLLLQMSNIVDYYSNAEFGVFSSFSKHPTMKYLAKRAKEWHDWVDSKSEANKGVWESALPEQTTLLGGKNWTITPLLTGDQLFEEGKAMHHCVSSFTRRCVMGASRVFSVTCEGQRYGTLELCYDSTLQDWRIGQYRGVCNAELTGAVDHELRRRMLERYRQAVSPTVAKMSALSP